MPPRYTGIALCICPVGDVFRDGAIDGKLTRCLATAIGRPGELSVGDVARAFSKVAEKSGGVISGVRGGHASEQLTALIHELNFT